MVLSFRERFSWGTVTLFKEKIESGEKIHTLRIPRADPSKDWKAGRDIHAYLNNPRNAHQVEVKKIEIPEKLNPESKVISVERLILNFQHVNKSSNEYYLEERAAGIPAIEGETVRGLLLDIKTGTRQLLRPIEIKMLAHNDGLTIDDFTRYFYEMLIIKKKGFHMSKTSRYLPLNIIHWTSLKYFNG